MDEHTSHQGSVGAPRWFHTADRQTNERIARRVAWVLTIVLGVNQVLIGSLMPKSASAGSRLSLSSLFGITTASARTIIAPQMSDDGRTTRLAEQPTISEVPANPKSGDALADAKAVMLGTGRPDYAPEGAAFDDPVTAQETWGSYEDLELSGDLLARYNGLTEAFLCNYCCGSPADVTRNRQCGCAHAKAARGYFKYMLTTYGDQYTDAQLMGEGYRWQAIWYPKGAVEDYLLATGNGTVIGHQTHGGAGADGMHGLTK